MAYESSLNILNNLVESCVPMCANIHKLPWSVNPPAALKFARTNGWKQYKEFGVFMAGSVTFELGHWLTLLRLIIACVTLSPAAEQSMSRA